MMTCGRWMVLAVAAMASVSGDASPVIGMCTQDPAVRVDCYPPLTTFPNATEETCLAQGCCWKPLDNGGIPCAFDAIGEPDSRRCAQVPFASRLPCRNPRFAVDDAMNDRHTCHSIGCCFDEDGQECFQPFFEGYELLTLEEVKGGWQGVMVLRRFKRGPFGNDVALLQLHVIKESASRVRIRITDPSFPRYEVPGVVENADEPTRDHPDPDYEVHFYERPFGIAVTRRGTDEVLFNSTPSTHADTSFNGLVFENQFLEISTHLQTHDAIGEPVLYGLGDHGKHARLKPGNHSYSLFSRNADNKTAHGNGNVHPMYVQLLSSGRAHGVFLFASTAIEVVTDDRAFTFRSTGGVVDLFVFSGPTFARVVNEYTGVVGRPAMPPVWALGYHIGRRDHESLDDALLEVTKMRVAGIPFDTFWLGAGYMYQGEAFTMDEKKFPHKATQAFLDDLHFNNQYLVSVVTPAIAVQPDSPEHADVLVVGDDGMDSLDCGSASDLNDSAVLYYPLQRGIDLDVFVKGVQGDRYAEKLTSSHWSAFVDFLHPNASTYWEEMLEHFYHEFINYDGVWMDIGVPTSTCDELFTGEHNRCDKVDASFNVRRSHPRADAGTAVITFYDDRSFVRSPDVAFPFDPFRQPFAPEARVSAFREQGNLNSATLPMGALHHQSLHYNVHSLYSYMQSKTTHRALRHILKRRSFSLSPASYAGGGKYAGYFLDNEDATWTTLRHSISQVISMNLVGIPLVAPSFRSSTSDVDKELSIRWHQALSFFPLLPFHGSDRSSHQSPLDYDEETANILRDVLLRRYRHLPYLYTQCFRAHAYGDAVVRPLTMDFSTDPMVFDLETQVLIGPALMVAPVVDKGAISLQVYFPNDTWFDLESGRLIKQLALENDHSDGDRFDLVLAPINTLPVYIRGGHIVPTQQPSTTTAMTKRGVYRLVVALATSDHGSSAQGQLFVDDGESLHSVQDNRYSLISFNATLKGGNRLQLSSRREVHGYDGPEMHVDIGEIVVYGVEGDFLSNSTLHLNSDSGHQSGRADYFAHSQLLLVSRLNVAIGDEWSLEVEAVNESPPHEPSRHTSDEGSRDHHESHSADTEDDGAAEQHGGKPPKGKENSEQGSESGDGEPKPITGEQAGKKKGITTIGIIGIVAGVIFVVAIFAIVLQRRRRGYTPIT